MKNIKVLFFAKDSRGGMETFINQMRGINSKYLQMKFCFYKRDKFISYRKADVLFNENYPLEMSFSFEKLFLFINNFRKTFSYISKNRPSIVFASDIYSFILCALVRFFLKYKFICLINNNLYEIILRRPGYLYKKLLIAVFKYLSAKADIFVFTSAKLGIFVKSTMIQKNVRTVVIHHSVDLNAIAGKLNTNLTGKELKLIKSSKPNIFYIGRLDEQKDPETVIKSFSVVTKVFKKARLFIVGDGSKKSDLVLLSKLFGISAKVLFLGWKKNIYLYLKKADLFVFSSHFEGFAMVIVESMAMNVPVVATDSPYGPSEILENGKYGLLVPVGDYKKMAQASVILLKNIKLRNYYIKNGFKRSRDFDSAVMIEKYRKLFLNLLNNN